jgi:hypothetical protein
MNQVAQPQKLGAQVAISGGDNGFAVTPQTLSDIVEFAKFMCQSNAGIPSYLRNNAPDCAAITMQALKWNFDPFSVAQKSYKVKDVLAYEAQLIAAVVNTRSGIKGRLKYAFEGEGATLTCTVTGILEGEEYSYTSPPVGSITTKNSPLWKTDPQQQLGYYSARSWARRYTPEVLLGVYDRDEAEEFRGPDKAKDVTPAFDPFSDDVYTPPQQPTVTGSTWTGDIDAKEPHDSVTGELPDTDDQSPLPDQSDASDPARSQAAADGETPPSSPSAATLFPMDRADLIECCKKMLAIPADTTLNAPAKRGVLETTKDDWKKSLPPELHPQIKTFFESADAQIKADPKVYPTLRQSAFVHFAEVLDCTVEELGG